MDYEIEPLTDIAAKTDHNEEPIRKTIFEFILTNFLFGNIEKMPKNTESLIGTGVVDSTGILELIEFIESTFGIAVEEDETIPKNLDSIANLVRFVGEKREVAKRRQE